MVENEIDYLSIRRIAPNFKFIYLKINSHRLLGGRVPSSIEFRQQPNWLFIIICCGRFFLRRFKFLTYELVIRYLCDIINWCALRTICHSVCGPQLEKSNCVKQLCTDLRRIFFFWSNIETMTILKFVTSK